MREEAIELIKKGYSLNKIKSITGINKSSLYYHYKKINGRKYNLIKINDCNKQKIGEFIGIFTGDGNFFFDKNKHHYRITIYTGLYEEDYRKHLKRLFKDLFSKTPRIYKNYKTNVQLTQYYSKDIYLLIKRYLTWNKNKTKSVRLKKIMFNEQNFLIGFLRGLFDTDGGIYKKKNKVAFGTASKYLAYQIRNILKSFNLPPGFYKYSNKDFYYIDLYGDRTRRFMKLIKPNNTNKIL